MRDYLEQPHKVMGLQFFYFMDHLMSKFYIVVIYKFFMFVFHHEPSSQFKEVASTSYGISVGFMGTKTFHLPF
jgi:hypothetical protein